LKNSLESCYYYRTKIHSLGLTNSTITLSTGVSFLILPLLFIPANSLKSSNVWATATEIPVYMLTTKDNRESLRMCKENMVIMIDIHLAILTNYSESVL
jgi:hypothetical protein